ncbi:hypothetical protein DEU56DRAFT_761026 [Suillus clintonianus]|uniref:uncharacterized protein n=1 Tax=Suillus clintonianus TaxID=1904413 RepID=UPI001B86B595|nr:uncharacterized protein DEU56DRAFT_761026 [Suillus clintonianus]KAG2119378.1 hypothetical protein DEU56DRAFT_761026 [Suillus clintonianus]
MLVNISSCFFVLRTYALWKNNKFVLAAMLTAFLIHQSGFRRRIHATSAIPGITGCSDSVDNFMPFLLLFAFELGLMLLTLIRAIQSWRMTSGPLYAVLVKHNIFYYACGLFLSGVNVLALLLLHVGEPLSPSMTEPLIFRNPVPVPDHVPRIIILTILALRMHLHLWQIDQHVQGSDVLVSNIVFIIPQLDISFASRSA